MFSSWVTTTTAAFCSRAMDFKRSITAPARSESSAAVGSSARMIPGVLASARAMATHYIRIVRGIMLKGADLADLQRDGFWLAGLMLIAMTIAVSRFRQTLD